MGIIYCVVTKKMGMFPTIFNTLLKSRSGWGGRPPQAAPPP